jgi:hypothetical protein
VIQVRIHAPFRCGVMPPEGQVEVGEKTDGFACSAQPRAISRRF